MYMTRTGTAAAAAQSTPIQPNEIEVRSAVTLTVRIQ
jgi:uncharacterized protein YggE